jgi:glycerate kinase
VRVDVLPLADGGNGLLDALSASDPRLTRRTVRVSGPIGDAVEAAFLSAPGRAVVESAEACGLHLVAPERLDPLAATTFGVGELLRAVAYGSGAARARVILGLGGSATVDGGAGMARALGWRLLDAAGRGIPAGGAGLAALRRILPPARPPGRWPDPPSGAGGVFEPAVLALADVRTPLTGPAGAAAVFGPQKGAGDRALPILEEGLANLRERVRADLGVEVGEMPGGGAAGGLGAGAVAFLGARLVSGSDWVLDELRFADRLSSARAVVTGEGAYDGQTAMGKIVGAVVERASAAGVPVVVICGRASAEPRRGVIVLSGEGGRLTLDDLAELAARGLAGALGERGD